MRRHRSWPLRLLAATLAFTAVGGCAAGGSSPSPALTSQPTPTPITVTVSNAADAAAIVIASDPRFAGTMEQRPDVIGASRWWTAKSLPGGGYRIELTIGWGDCPSGCINRHVWTFDVDASGGLTPVNESGDPVPSTLPA
jgi:hypothetical protein